MILYRACRYLELPQETALRAIPDNAALTAKGVRTKDMLDFYQKQQNFFPVLFSSSSVEQINLLFNHVLLKEQWKKLAENSSLYISLHVDENEELLFVVETTKRYNKLLSDMFRVVCAAYPSKNHIYKDNTVYQLQIEDKSLFLNVHNGLLLLTFSEKLMRLAINRLETKEDTLSAIPDFSLNRRNEKAKVLLAIQYRYFIPCLKEKLRKAGAKTALPQWLSPCVWSVYDMETKNRDILLSGYTGITVSVPTAQLLLHQKHQVDFLKILPVDANNILSIKANTAQDWKKIRSAVRTSEDFLELMYPLQMLSFEIREKDTEAFHYLVIHSANSSEASFHLFNSLVSSFSDNHYLLDTLHSGSLLIGHIHLPDFVFAETGMAYLTQPEYYTIIDDYIVFADTKEGILNYVAKIRSNKTFQNATLRQALRAYFPNRANLFYYYDFSLTQSEPTNNLSRKRYEENIQTIQMQMYPASDSILLTKIVFRMR
jgi:hypothetical protein